MQLVLLLRDLHQQRHRQPTDEHQRQRAAGQGQRRPAAALVDHAEVGHEDTAVEACAERLGARLRA